MFDGRRTHHNLNRTFPYDRKSHINTEKSSFDGHFLQPFSKYANQTENIKNVSCLENDKQNTDNYLFNPQSTNLGERPRKLFSANSIQQYSETQVPRKEETEDRYWKRFLLLKIGCLMPL